MRLRLLVGAVLALAIVVALLGGLRAGRSTLPPTAVEAPVTAVPTMSDLGDTQPPASPRVSR